MRRWEYLWLTKADASYPPQTVTYSARSAQGERRMTIDVAGPTLLDLFNALGAEGWEMVDSSHPYIFKRPLPD